MPSAAAFVFLAVSKAANWRRYSSSSVLHTMVCGFLVSLETATAAEDEATAESFVLCVYCVWLLSICRMCACCGSKKCDRNCSSSAVCSTNKWMNSAGLLRWLDGAAEGDRTPLAEGDSTALAAGLSAWLDASTGDANGMGVGIHPVHRLISSLVVSRGKATTSLLPYSLMYFSASLNDGRAAM